MSFLSQFGVRNDVTVIENHFSEVHWNSYNKHNWNSNCVQQTQQASQNFNTQPLHEVPNPVYESLIEDIASINYQESNFHFIPQTHFNQSRNLQDLLQNQLVAPCNHIHNGNFFDHSHPRPYLPQTNYVNTKAGLKGVTKRKRKRTMFTTEQVAVLEKVFLSKPYINRDERQALVKELQIKDKVIKVWFQNRRLKEKREAEEAEQELYSPDAEPTEAKYQFDELSYIESQINQTDKFGFVTLDERAMNGLVNVLDTLLPKEAQVNLLEENRAVDIPNQDEKQNESEGSPIYEPISPASSECCSSEASTSFEPFEPKESLQRIFDVQEFLIFKKKTV